jgi:hypothetical protein
MKSRTKRPLAKGEQGVLLPGATGAEPWEMWIVKGGQAECAQIYSRPRENHAAKSTTFALPVAQVHGLPFWLNETDSRRLEEMIPLQLESRGLHPRHQEPLIFDWSVVTREAGRTLVVAAVLPVSLSREIETEGYGSFDLSARYFPLPENALTLWREQDILVCAITRGASLAYFHALGEGPIGPRILQDLSCIMTGLALQEVLAPLQQVVAWFDATPAELASLKEALQLPVRPGERPSPQIPATPWKLVPATVQQARQAREKRRWWRRAILLAIALYVLIAIAIAGQFLLTSAKVKELESWQAQHAQALALVRDTKAAWKDLLPVVDEKNYPLELLLNAAQAIPAEQLHLTLFEAGDGHVLIKGEAKNVAAAFEFLDSLKKSPGLAEYQWEMGQTHFLPNDLAQFQIDGTRGPGGAE